MIDSGFFGKDTNVNFSALVKKDFVTDISSEILNIFENIKSVERSCHEIILTHFNPVLHFM